MGLTLGPSHLLTRFSHFIEAFFGRFAGINMCVTKAMSQDLQKNWGVWYVQCIYTVICWLYTTFKMISMLVLLHCMIDQQKYFVRYPCLRNMNFFSSWERIITSFPLLAQMTLY
jgi:hypothetical protein